MNKHITFCRNIEASTDRDCAEARSGEDLSTAAPCKVVREECDKPVAEDYVGPEAESSSVWKANLDDTCCDCN